MQNELPALRTIAPERWADVLRPLDDGERHRAASRLDFLSEDWRAVWQIISELMLEDIDRAAEQPPTRLVPAAPAPASPVRGRQVNVKLSADEHRSLALAAATFGLRPTQLARQLVVRGVRQIEEEG